MYDQRVMHWKKATLPAAALILASVAVGVCASLARRAAKLSAPEVKRAIEFLDALDAGDTGRLEGLVAVYWHSRRGEEYSPLFDPATFGGSADAREAYLRSWTDRARDALHGAGVEEASAGRIVGVSEVKDPKGTEVLLEYKTSTGRVRMCVVMAGFTPPRFAFIAREGWRRTKAHSGVVRTVVRAPINVYLVDPRLMEFVRGRVPPGLYPVVEVARGLPPGAADEFVEITARGVFVAGEPVEKDAFGDAAARVRGPAKTMVVFADEGVGWPIVEVVLDGLLRAGFEEVAFVACTKRPPAALKGGRDCLGVVRCVPGAHVENPEFSLVPIVGPGHWVAAEEDGTPKTVPFLPTASGPRSMLEAAARGGGVRIHMPPEARLAHLLQVLQFFGEDPSKAELSGPLRLKPSLREPPAGGNE